MTLSFLQNKKKVHFLTVRRNLGEKNTKGRQQNRFEVPQILCIYIHLIIKESTTVLQPCHRARPAVLWECSSLWCVEPTLLWSLSASLASTSVLFAGNEHHLCKALQKFSPLGILYPKHILMNL